MSLRVKASLNKSSTSTKNIQSNRLLASLSGTRSASPTASCGCNGTALRRQVATPQLASP
jgi:hypothetical protein